MGPFKRRSIKTWDKIQKHHCKLVILVAETKNKKLKSDKKNKLIRKRRGTRIDGSEAPLISSTGCPSQRRSTD